MIYKALVHLDLNELLEEVNEAAKSGFTLFQILQEDNSIEPSGKFQIPYQGINLKRWVAILAKQEDFSHAD